MKKDESVSRSTRYSAIITNKNEFDPASNLLLRTRQHSVPKAREDLVDSNIDEVALLKC